jgi:hypothetical protein
MIALLVASLHACVASREGTYLFSFALSDTEDGALEDQVGQAQVALLDLYPLSGGGLAVYDGGTALTGSGSWTSFEVGRSSASTQSTDGCTTHASREVSMLGSFAWDGGFDATLTSREISSQDACGSPDGRAASQDVTLRFVGTGQRIAADDGRHGGASYARFYAAPDDIGRDTAYDYGDEADDAPDED